MHIYDYDSLIVDGLTIHIDDVIAGKQVPATGAEGALFSFIQQWFAGQENFSLKTSGSTGTPKSITISRQQMIASALRTEQAIGLKQGDVALVCLHPDYIAGKMMLVRCFVTGMKIVFVSPSSNPFQKLGDREIDFCALVPLQIHDILQSSYKERLQRVKLVLTGGGALDPVTVKSLQELECRCYATYGMTETVSHIALRLLNTANATPHYVALPGVALSLDTRGCLVIDCDALPHRVFTNDVVELLDNERFIWLGRWDNVINTGGVKIIPEPIEEKIERIFRAAAIKNRFYLGSVPDRRLENKIALVIEGSVSRKLVRSSLLALKLEEPYGFPKLILFSPAFIEAANGKVNRSETTIQALQLDHSSV